MNRIKVSLSLPFNLGSSEWEPDDAERRAAWSLYVELVAHIAVEPLDGHDGLLREMLSSLHSPFAITREIVRKRQGRGLGLARVGWGHCHRGAQQSHPPGACTVALVPPEGMFQDHVAAVSDTNTESEHRMFAPRERGRLRKDTCDLGVQRLTRGIPVMSPANR